MTTGLTVGLVFVLVRGLVDTRPVLIVNSTPKEASSRSMITALLYVLIAALLSGLLGGVLLAQVISLEDFGLAVLVFMTLIGALVYATAVGLVVGIFWGLNNGGWFVVLQKIAHRRLARAGNLPSPPYDFLEWGIDSHIFRRVGGGVRFRHNLIQQHLASTSD